MTTENISPLRNQHRLLAQSAYQAIYNIMTLEDEFVRKAIQLSSKNKEEDPFQVLLRNVAYHTPLQQQHALSAFGKAYGNKGKKQVDKYLKFCKEYRSHIRKFPAMVRINSLTSAVAFVNQKRGNDEAWACINQQLNTYFKNYAKQWLIGSDNQWTNFQAFIINCSAPAYRMLTRRALGFAEQLADYAVGMMPAKVDQKTDKANTDQIQDNGNEKE